jgi:hypothetical protein
MYTMYSNTRHIPNTMKSIESIYINPRLPLQNHRQTRLDTLSSLPTIGRRGINLGYGVERPSHFEQVTFTSVGSIDDLLDGTSAAWIDRVVVSV